MPLDVKNPNAVFYWKPHEASQAAFLIEAFRILTSDLSPSWWQPRLNIDQQPPELRPTLARHDVFLKAVEEGLVAAAKAKVEACGIDAATPAAQIVIDELVTGYRTCGALHEQALASGPGYYDLIYLPAQALAGFCINTPRGKLGDAKFYTYVASLLNDGVPSHHEKYGLAGRHVKAADKRWERDVIAMVHRARRDERIADALLTSAVDITQSMVRNVMQLYREARDEKRLRMLRGTELARAVHASRAGDLFFHIDRVDEMFRRARAA